VPGLALATHYAAALHEAEVGGDFYDVFQTDDTCTALVVGDLSGKGLAAATQVSIVRNMLRAYLYSFPSLGAAITELNRVLAENSLLTGFTTLFVGMFDSEKRILNYVNCGQEPGLVLRSDTGSIERLAPTGPVLGVFAESGYNTRTVDLCPGDGIVVFTDGLTEAGCCPDTMLGIEGVEKILAETTRAQGRGSRPQQLVAALVAGAERAAPSGMRDDLSLLVAVVA
jgi:serine phosphatase RsbU (regulator of sigma subunit)